MEAISIRTNSPTNPQMSLSDFDNLTRQITTYLANTYGFDPEEALFKLKEVKMKEKQMLFQNIYENVRSRLTYEFIKSLKTKKGNTQSAERPLIQRIKETLIHMELSFTEAGSQQPYDFRVRMPGSEEQDILKLEIKKTDSNTIIFNDTCPSDDVYYIVINTGHVGKKSEKYPLVVPIQGGILVNGPNDQWIKEYLEFISKVKSQTKKEQTGYMRAFARPNLSANIGPIFAEKYEECKVLPAPSPEPESEAEAAAADASSTTENSFNN